MYNLFDKSVFTIYQGNSIELNIYLTDSDTGEYVQLDDGSYVLFTIEDKNHNKVIQKKLTSSDYRPELDPPALSCSIEADETINLTSGEYLYDCLYVEGNSVTTFISSTVVIARAIGKYTDVSENGGEADG